MVNKARSLVVYLVIHNKCCRVLFWSSIEIAMQVVGAELRAQLFELLPPYGGRACIRSDTAQGSAQAIKSVQHFASRGATFKKGAETHVFINMAVVLRAKIDFISTRPEGLTAVHGSLKWY